jgi:hypothetical protein
MKQLCERYALLIQQKSRLSIGPRRATEPAFFSAENDLGDLFQDTTTVHHILWMLEEIPKMYDWANNPKREDGSYYLNAKKSQRWLGFVQGWMWANGYISINDMRQDVKNANL